MIPYEELAARIKAPSTRTSLVKCPANPTASNYFYYKNDSPSLEMDFFVRDSDSLVPVGVKTKDGATAYTYVFVIRRFFRYFVNR